jgi:hypothetical protein
MPTAILLSQAELGQGSERERNQELDKEKLSGGYRK